MKDWFVNDPAVSIDVKSMRAWISSEADFLKVAYDVANGSKHMALRNGGWAGGSSQTRNDATVGFDRGARHTFYITDARAKQDHEALELADLCLGEWRTFQTSVGLAVTD